MKNKHRNLTRLKEKVFNNPLLITETSLLPITSYLKNPERNWSSVNHEVSDSDKLVSDFDYSKKLESYEEQQLISLKERAGINPETNIGYIDVSGALVAKAGQVQGCVELTSYEKIKALTKIQISLGVKAINYIIDSNGGEAYLAFSTAKDLRKMADQAGIVTFAYVDGAACSAAYQVASAAHVIVANEDSDIGSIGVLIQLINPSKHLEQQGLERTFITAGEHKVPFEADGSFNKEFIDRLQAGVLKTYDKFVTTVSELRNLPKEVIINTQARVYSSDEALSLGLIDKIMEYEDFDNYVLSVISNKSTGYSQYLTDVSPVEKQSLNNNHKETVTMTDKTVEQVVLENVVEQVEQASVATVQDSQLADLQEKLTTLNTDLTAKQEAYEALSVEKGEVEKLLSSAQDQVKHLTSQLDAIKLSQLEAERKEKLSAVLGSENEQVPSLLATTMALDDVAFGAIVSALEAKVEKEDAQLNVEAGNSANQDTTPPDYNAALKAQFSKK